VPTTDLPTSLARIGDPVDAIDTPALVVDVDAMERNLDRMATFARRRGLRLRPHAKMHKCAAIAKLQLAAGAVGICVQKLSEAQALAAAGIDDIYISNEIVDTGKLAQLATLALRVRLGVAVDSTLGVERLARAMASGGHSVDVYVEIDVGHGRCGVPPQDAAALARLVQRHAPPGGGLRFAGLQAYHGSAQHLRSPAQRQAAVRQAAECVQAARAALAGAGIECQLVTGGGTGTCALEAANGAWGELQAGSYLFMDRDYADNDAVPADDDTPVFEHALFLKSQVMSRPPTAHGDTPRAVIDAGHKAHAVDSGPPRVWGRDLVFANGGDEHGLLRPGRDPLPAIGDTVWLVPGHCDPTVNLHDQIVAVRGGLDAGRVEALWTVDARGCVR
jgi:D-serine deaminase-like pyridoxal phosphate-dependent protein